MEELYTVTRRGFSLSARLIPVGADLCVIVTGGASHIGGASLAQPGQPAQSLCRPSHRDDVVSARFAQVLSARFGTNVAVLCGIHYDNAAAEDIQQLLELSWELLEKLCKKGGGST